MSTKSLLIEPTRRFSERVEFYRRSRPRYPGDIISFLRHRYGLKPGDAVADVGSGTGLLSELFLADGQEVFGVEPNAEMRAAAEEIFKNEPRFHSINGTAEATTLPPASMRFVLAGQAFHWFDPIATRKEFLRILQKDGIVALIWNERIPDATPFAVAYQHMIEKYNTDHAAVAARSIRATIKENLQRFFGHGGYELTVFANAQSLDAAGLADRVTSSSYMPMSGAPGYDELHRHILEIFAAHAVNERVEIPYHCMVYSGALSSASDF